MNFKWILVVLTLSFNTFNIYSTDTEVIDFKKIGAHNSFYFYIESVQTCFIQEGTNVFPPEIRILREIMPKDKKGPAIAIEEIIDFSGPWVKIKTRNVPENIAKTIPTHLPLSLLEKLKENSVLYIEINKKIIQLIAKQNLSTWHIKLFTFEHALQLVKNHLAKTKINTKSTTHTTQNLTEPGIFEDKQNLKKNDINNSENKSKIPNTEKKQNHSSSQSKPTSKYKTSFRNTFYIIGLCALPAIIYYGLIPELQRNYQDTKAYLSKIWSHLFEKK